MYCATRQTNCEQSVPYQPTESEDGYAPRPRRKEEGGRVLGCGCRNEGKLSGELTLFNPLIEGAAFQTQSPFLSRTDEEKRPPLGGHSDRSGPGSNTPIDILVAIS